MSNPDFLAAFQTGYKFFSSDEEIIFTSHDIGDLIITSGKLMAADALVRMAEQPFDIELKPGHYPISLSVARFLSRNTERVAYAMFSVSPQIPVRWEMATYLNQDSIVLSERQFIGYAVDSGKGWFMDAEVEEILLDRECIEPMEETLWYKLSDLLDRNLWASMYVDVSENKQANIIAFSTGWGDGVYPSYYGYDEKGQIAKIVTDFQLF